MATSGIAPLQPTAIGRTEHCVYWRVAIIHKLHKYMFTHCNATLAIALQNSRAWAANVFTCTSLGVIPLRTRTHDYFVIPC